MSGYYPPGVTGNEPQIAGYPEIEMEVECGESDTYFLGLYQVREMIMDLGFAGQGTVEMCMTAKDVLDGIDGLDIAERDCSWQGTVAVEIEGDQAYWNCPRCGSSQSEQIETGPDPDDERDRRRGF